MQTDLSGLINFKCPLAALCKQYISIEIHLDVKVWITRSFDGEMWICKTRLNLTLWEKNKSHIVRSTDNPYTQPWLYILPFTYFIYFEVIYIWPTFHTNFPCQLSSQKPLTTDCIDLCHTSEIQVWCWTGCSLKHLLDLTLSDWPGTDLITA